MSKDYSTAYMTIEVSDMPPTAELMIGLTTPSFYWGNADVDATNVGMSLNGVQGTAFPLVTVSVTTNQITLVIGDESSTFTLGLPISYPSGIANPTAGGSLAIDNPGNTMVFMTAGGGPQQQPINGSWSLPLS